MSVAQRQPMSLQEFLAWEERQELRWEFDGFAPVAMTGGTWRHTAIQMNLAGCLYTRLRGKSCRPAGDTMQIQVAGSIRYPDAFVVCSAVGPADRTVTEPVVVFEILSPSTALTDRTTKNDEYRATLSIRRYVMLEQDARAATMFVRDGDKWVGTYVSGDAILAMPEIGIEIPLADIYEGVSFGGSDANPQAEAEP